MFYHTPIPLNERRLGYLVKRMNEFMNTLESEEQKQTFLNYTKAMLYVIHESTGDFPEEKGNKDEREINSNEDAF